MQEARVSAVASLATELAIMPEQTGTAVRAGAVILKVATKFVATSPIVVIVVAIGGIVCCYVVATSCLQGCCGC